MQTFIDDVKIAKSKKTRTQTHLELESEPHHIYLRFLHSNCRYYDTTTVFRMFFPISFDIDLDRFSMNLLLCRLFIETFAWVDLRNLFL